MRFHASGGLRRNLAQGAAIILVGGVAAGCSSDVSRFHDSILTGSSRTAQAAPAQQPYPGDYAGNLDNTYTGSVDRSGLRTMNVSQRNVGNPVPQQNVGGAGQPQYGAQQPVYAQAPSQAYPAPQVPSGAIARGPALAPAGGNIDYGSTGTVPSAQPVAPPPVQQARQLPAVGGQRSQAGWDRAGGTQVTIRDGETLYNLSRRYGVPVEAILQANQMREGQTLAAGQQIVIPSYAHSQTAGVSAPDNNPRVANAGSGAPAPTPAPAQGDRVVVLPQQPKPQEGQPQVAASAGTSDDRTSGAGGATYTVAAGDTLSSIARRNGTSTDALKAANGLSSGLIRVGQNLSIPSSGAPAGDPARTQLASAPSNLGTIKAEPAANAQANTEPQVAAYTPPAATEQAVRDAVQTAAVAPSSTGISQLRWPVDGRITAPFGTSVGGRPNDGIDIAVPNGTPVRAAENGVVIYAGDGLKDFGNTVLLRHDSGLVTVYGHASEIKVARGETVRRGQEIARSGMSGSADSPKLHFEVRKDSTPVDPTTYLE